MSTAPLPERDWPLTQPFWEAAESNRLMIPRCSDCQRYVWYPEEKCPHCGGEDTPWEAVSGRGVLFSYAEVKHPLYPPYEDALPYITGIVTLEEDSRVRLVTRIVGAAAEDLAMDQPMEVCFETLTFKGVEGRVIAPVFRPAS